MRALRHRNNNANMATATTTASPPAAGAVHQQRHSFSQNNSPVGGGVGIVGGVYSKVPKMPQSGAQQRQPIAFDHKYMRSLSNVERWLNEGGGAAAQTTVLAKTNNARSGAAAAVVCGSGAGDKNLDTIINTKQFVDKLRMTEKLTEVSTAGKAATVSKRNADGSYGSSATAEPVKKTFNKEVLLMGPRKHRNVSVSKSTSIATDAAASTTCAVGAVAAAAPADEQIACTIEAPVSILTGTMSVSESSAATTATNGTTATTSHSVTTSNTNAEVTINHSEQDRREAAPAILADNQSVTDVVSAAMSTLVEYASVPIRGEASECENLLRASCSEDSSSGGDVGRGGRGVGGESSNSSQAGEGGEEVTSNTSSAVHHRYVHEHIHHHYHHFENGGSGRGAAAAVGSGSIGSAREIV